MKCCGRLVVRYCELVTRSVDRGVVVVVDGIVVVIVVVGVVVVLVDAGWSYQCMEFLLSVACGTCCCNGSTLVFTRVIRRWDPCGDCMMLVLLGR